MAYPFPRLVQTHILGRIGSHSVVSNGVIFAWCKSNAMQVNFPITFSSVKNIVTGSYFSSTSTVNATCYWISGVLGYSSYDNTSVKRIGDQNSHITRTYLIAGI